MDYVAESIGTFVFVSVILIIGDPIAIGITLAAVIYFTNHVSKSAVNPCVVFCFWLRGDLPLSSSLCYIFAEIIGAVLAYYWWGYTIRNISTPSS